jgi:hypothetical protein
MISLSIGGLSICGSHGGTVTISVQDAWEIYHRHITKQAEGPVCVLRDGVKWVVDGLDFNEPSEWFLKLKDCPLDIYLAGVGVLPIARKKAAA